MKKLLLIAILLCAQGLFAQEDTAIKQSIQTFFEGMHARDTVMMKSVCMKEFALHSIQLNVKGNQFSTEDVSLFYKGIASLPKSQVIEERLFNYTIQHDGGIAQVWTPYEFYFNNTLSHSGINAFTLVKVNGAWKISYIVDTRKTSGQ